MYFLLFPEWIGYGYFTNGDWIFLKISSGFIITYLPFICLLMITRIFLNVVEIKTEYYNKNLRIWEIIQNIAVLILCAVILKGGTGITFEDTSEATDALSKLFKMISAVIVISIIISCVVDIIKHVRGLLKLAE